MGSVPHDTSVDEDDWAILEPRDAAAPGQDGEVGWAACLPGSLGSLDRYCCTRTHNVLPTAGRDQVEDSSEEARLLEDGIRRGGCSDPLPKDVHCNRETAELPRIEHSHESSFRPLPLASSQRADG